MPAPSVGSKSLAKLAAMTISEVERKPVATAPETKQVQEVQAPATLAWRNRSLSLGDDFYTPLPAQPLPEPHWVATSADCAALLGLPADWARRPDWQALDVRSGNAAWPGMQPLASVYSGHQLLSRWSAKLGLTTAEPDDRALADDLLRLMAADHCDFSITFRRLAWFASEAGAPHAPLRNRFMNRVSVRRLGTSLRRAPEARARRRCRPGLANGPGQPHVSPV